MKAQPRPSWLALLLMAVVIIVWLPVLDATFQFDDWSVIVRDTRVASLAAWWAAMPAIRPLQKLVYALGHELGGAPVLYRAFNLLLHAVNTVLVFGLVRRLARRMRTADAQGATQIGAYTAVIFALHPVQTEAVTYIAGGSLVFMSTCALGCIAAFLRSTEGEHRAPWLLLSLLSLLAAMAVRETALVLPLACALWWFAESGGRGVQPPRGALLLLTVAALGALTAGLWWTAYPWLIETSLAIRSPWQNLLAQGDAIAWLLGQLVRWDRLNADPGFVVDSAITWLNVARALLLGAILVAAACQWRSRRWVAFGVLWFFLWLAPTNSLLARFDLANERQLYLALLGPAWLAAQGLQRLRAQGPLVVALLAMLLAGATALRNRVYVDEISFWQDVTLKSPDNARAANNLGMALAAACQPLAARRAFDNATLLRPDDPKPRINRELLERGELPGVPARCTATADPSAPR
jgi:protein O-mannosyl-transferase